MPARTLALIIIIAELGLIALGVASVASGNPLICLACTGEQVVRHR